jgi:hypothetical protein
VAVVLLLLHVLLLVLAMGASMAVRQQRTGVGWGWRCWYWRWWSSGVAFGGGETAAVVRLVPAVLLVLVLLKAHRCSGSGFATLV